MELTVGCTPEPDKLILVGEFVALLVTVTRPDTLPVLDGAKVTFRIVFCPGPRMIPDAPVALKPGPETLTLEMVALELPELVRVALKVLLVPMLTAPKVKLEGLAVNCDEPELTERVAALLVVLPAELLTVTVTCAPLSDAVVAGVV
jgi:hypothetical protein